MLTFNKKNTPDLKVSDAVRMSMGIPFFFNIYKWTGKYKGVEIKTRVVDGGVTSNFPLIAYFREATQGEAVLGFSLEKVDPEYIHWTKRLIRSVQKSVFLHPWLRITSDLVETFLTSSDALVATHDDWTHIIKIPVDVGTTEFNLSDEKKEELIQRGKHMTRERLDLINRGKRAAAADGYSVAEPLTNVTAKEWQRAKLLAEMELSKRAFHMGEEITVDGVTYVVQEVHDDVGLAHKGISLLTQELNYYAIATPLGSEKKYVLSYITNEKATQLKWIQDLPLKRIENIVAISKNDRGEHIKVSEFLPLTLNRDLADHLPTTHEGVAWNLKNAITVGEDLLILQNKGSQFGGVTYTDVYVNDDNEWVLVHYGKEGRFSDVSGLASILYGALTGRYLERREEGWAVPKDAKDYVVLKEDDAAYYPNQLNTQHPRKGKQTYLAWING